MRYIYFIGAIVGVIAMTSCTTTRETVSAAKFNKTVAEVNAELTADGYQLAGKSSEQKNEVVVTGQSYSKYTGYGTLMDNNTFTVDTYKFSNAENQTISYSVKYKIENDYGGGTTYAISDVIDCGCSDVKKYNEICGDNGKVKKIDEMTADQKSTFYDKAKTYWGLLGGTLGGSILVYIIAMAAI